MAVDPVRPIVTVPEPAGAEEPPDPQEPDPELALAEADGPDLDQLLPPGDEAQEEMIVAELAWLAAPAGVAGVVIVAVVALLRQAWIVAKEVIVALWHLTRRRPMRGGRPG